MSEFSFRQPIQTQNWIFVPDSESEQQQWPVRFKVLGSPKFIHIFPQSLIIQIISRAPTMTTQCPKPCFPTTTTLSLVPLYLDRKNRVGIPAGQQHIPIMSELNRISVKQCNTFSMYKTSKWCTNFYNTIFIHTLPNYTSLKALLLLFL